MQTNQFDDILKQGAYRWLHCIDFRSFSSTNGCCDREYWAWKTKDYANGTLQGGLAGFLDCLDILDLTKDQVTHVVQSVIAGSLGIQRRNGSFEEAYPLESSYAVTGLVLYSLMYSRLKYPQYFDEKTDDQLRTIAYRARGFLKKTPETHGVISNHIATSELSLALSSVWLNEALEKMTVFRHQHQEGWFQEYEGADPGYQSLLESYFAGAIALLPADFVSGENLKRSRTFSACFKLPNGGFSGEIGARGTGIFYPGSLILDRSGNDTLWFLSKYVSSINSVTPTSVDINNFIPVFNSWALFRTLVRQISLPNEVHYLSQDFPKAGFFVRHYENEHLVISMRNCNWRHLVRKNMSWEDNSVAILTKGSKILSRGNIVNISEKKISFVAHIQLRPKQKLNDLLKGIALRIVAVLFFFVPYLQRILKQFLARYVMGSNAVDSNENIFVNVILKPRIHFEYSSSEVKAISFGFKSHMASANNFETRAI